MSNYDFGFEDDASAKKKDGHTQGADSGAWDDMLDDFLLEPSRSPEIVTPPADNSTRNSPSPSTNKSNNNNNNNKNSNNNIIHPSSSSPVTRSRSRSPAARSRSPPARAGRSRPDLSIASAADTTVPVPSAGPALQGEDAGPTLLADVDLGEAAVPVMVASPPSVASPNSGKARRGFSFAVNKVTGRLRQKRSLPSRSKVVGVVDAAMAQDRQKGDIRPRTTPAASSSSTSISTASATATPLSGERIDPYLATQGSPSISPRVTARMAGKLRNARAKADVAVSSRNIKYPGPSPRAATASAPRTNTTTSTPTFTPTFTRAPVQEQKKPVITTIEYSDAALNDMKNMYVKRLQDLEEERLTLREQYIREGEGKAGALLESRIQMLEELNQQQQLQFQRELGGMRNLHQSEVTSLREQITNSSHLQALAERVTHASQELNSVAENVQRERPAKEKLIETQQRLRETMLQEKESMVSAEREAATSMYAAYERLRETLGEERSRGKMELSSAEQLRKTLHAEIAVLRDEIQAERDRLADDRAVLTNDRHVFELKQEREHKALKLAREACDKLKQRLEEMVDQQAATRTQAMRDLDKENIDLRNWKMKLAQETRALQGEQQAVRDTVAGVRQREALLESRAVAMKQQAQALHKQSVELRGLRAQLVADTEGLQQRRAALDQRQVLLDGDRESLVKQKEELSRESGKLEAYRQTGFSPAASVSAVPGLPTSTTNENRSTGGTQKPPMFNELLQLQQMELRRGLDNAIADFRRPSFASSISSSQAFGNLSKLQHVHSHPGTPTTRSVTGSSSDPGNQRQLDWMDGPYSGSSSHNPFANQVRLLYDDPALQAELADELELELALDPSLMPTLPEMGEFEGRGY